MRWRQERSAAGLAALAQSLAHLNPQAVLERGYAIVSRSDGAIVQDSAQLQRGEVIALRFARGGAAATVDDLDA
jgi:exodeoxyribonuclease VII large subunit